MLKKIQCDKFISKGQVRPPIEFKKGLNTILGGLNANNSIGKSTLLLIIDFAYGGNSYLDSDAVNQVGLHTINFEFEFNDRSYFFSRSTTQRSTINKCDEHFNFVEEINIKDFLSFLQEQYGVHFYGSSFRELISRYFRIYGKNNHDEKKPLHSDPREKNVAAITALEKLFNSFEVIESYRTEFKKVSDKLDALKKAKKQDVISYGSITTKKRYNENLNELEKLKDDLRNHTVSNNSNYVDLDLKQADQISQIKTQLNILMRNRTSTKTQLSLVEDNLSSNPEVHHGPYEELEQFFPGVNIRKISEIESFHEKLSVILMAEYEQQRKELSKNLERLNHEIDSLKNQLSKHGEPANYSTTYLNKYKELNLAIERLEAQNRDYLLVEELNVSKKGVKEQLQKVEEAELRGIESSINEQMVRFNDRIYEKKRKAPVLDLDSGTTYEFYTPDDSGTGTSYKSLIVFDLSVLETTMLPALAHDSLLFKNIGDEPLNKIIQLYTEFDKQIFIAFDKGESYSEETSQILNTTAVIRLNENGDELFGRSWNIKE